MRLLCLVTVKSITASVQDMEKLEIRRENANQYYTISFPTTFCELAAQFRLRPIIEGKSEAGT